ncbi:beta-amylase 8-like isoform X1 [Silene latifolia]|uniref:beta-amylase 8-like isoform X1 n=1 Tax=Silene latifolia TaxID=37657 RepID=UPI003D773BF0
MNDAGEMTTTPVPPPPPAITTSNHHPQFPNPNPNNNNVTQLEPSFKSSTSRRPRGFAVTATNAGGGRREREKEKERTKLRERHRRAITSRMLSGLRQYGNFHLPSRADMNDVLSALARNAGWIVDSDGTTYRRPEAAGLPVRSSESTLSGSSLKNCSMKAPLDCQPTALRIDENLSPASLYSVVVTDMETKSEKYTSTSNVDSAESLEAHQLIHDVQSGWREDNFAGTPYVPVYVKLASGIINSYCQLVDPEGIRQELKHLKSLNVDGVFVECWWGIVEGWSPQKYVWLGYRDLFMIIREIQLKLQAALNFHEYGGGDAGNAFISLPHWVLEIGKDNQDIFFTDREGRRNTECLSWGIDKERVLRGRTGIEVYYDLMRSFCSEFDDLFGDGLISAVEIGLGASGELKFPSFPERSGWKYPGIGEFQCYDRYLLQNLGKAAKAHGHSFWAKGPDNAGLYNSRPRETGFFCEKGDYDSYFGRFFLHWYAQMLVDHADNILSLATLTFDKTQIVVKIPSVYWWYKTASHASELTAGYYNPTNRDGYSPVLEILKKHSVTMKFVCPAAPLHFQGNEDVLADPDGLSWQVLNTAWDHGLTVAGQNAEPCYDRGEHIKIIETSKPINDPDHHHFAFFVYQLPSPFSQTPYCFSELDYLIKALHGEVGHDQENAEV